MTLLHLLGLDDSKLRYFQAGREKQLSQTGGELIREVLARPNGVISDQTRPDHDMIEA